MFFLFKNILSIIFALSIIFVYLLYQKGKDMYYIRFTDNKDLTKSFNHFTNEKLKGVCCYPLANVNDNGLCYEIRNNVNPTYQKYYNGNFIVFTGNYVEDNFNGEGVIVEVENIVATGVVSENEFGWFIEEINLTEGNEDL